MIQFKFNGSDVVLGDFLRKDGGNVTGHISSNSQNFGFTTNTSGVISYSGGSGIGNGATLKLYGKYHSQKPGVLEIACTNGSKTKSLELVPPSNKTTYLPSSYNGTLLWGDNVVGFAYASSTDGGGCYYNGTQGALYPCSHLYYHQIIANPASDGKKCCSLVIYNNNSTALDSNEAVAKWLYDNDYRTLDTRYPVNMSWWGSNSNQWRASGIYSGDGSNISFVKITETENYYESSTWRDHVWRIR